MARGLINTLLSLQTTPATANSLDTYLVWNEPKQAYQAVLTGSGAVTATLSIEVSHDNEHFFTLADISLSGTDSATDGFVSDAPWRYVRAKLNTISGTSAAVSVIAGV